MNKELFVNSCKKVISDLLGPEYNGSVISGFSGLDILLLLVTIVTTSLGNSFLDFHGTGLAKILINCI